MIAPERLAPRDVAALAAALSRATPRTRLVAGATDLALELRAAGERPDLLVDLSGLRDLAFIRRDGERIRVGALTTFAQLQHDPMISAGARCLASAASRVGSAQIRNVATIGGNVAHASPCADSIPALLALGADVGILGADGAVVRRDLRELLDPAAGARLRTGEAIVDFSFPSLGTLQRSAFAKVGARTSVAVAKLNAALVITLDAARRSVLEARVAFGSVAPTAHVSEAVGAALRGRTLDGHAAAAFADACAALVAAAIPDRSSMPYKMQAIRGLADDLWSSLIRA
jgi:CO/xanthine dehydrogenase FAD-binding subunit